MNLPQEIAFVIFSSLNLADLCSISAVCKTFSAITRRNDSQLWKRHFLSISEIPEGSAAQEMERSPNWKNWIAIYRRIKWYLTGTASSLERDLIPFFVESKTYVREVLNVRCENEEAVMKWVPGISSDSLSALFEEEWEQ